MTEETGKALKRALSFIEAAPRLRPLLSGPSKVRLQADSGECNCAVGKEFKKF